MEANETAASKVGNYLGLDLIEVVSPRRRDMNTYAVMSPTGKELFTITFCCDKGEVYYGGNGWTFAEKNQQAIKELLS